MAIEDRIEEMRIMASKPSNEYGRLFERMPHAGEMELLVHGIIVASVANFDGQARRAFSAVKKPSPYLGADDFDHALNDLEKHGYITRNQDKTEAVVTDKLLDILKQRFGIQNLDSELPDKEKGNGRELSLRHPIIGLP